MNLQLSKIGQALSGHSGIVELMDDLGAALAGGSSMYMLGGGNPAHIPEVQALWRQRLTEIVANEPLCDRMLSNYDGPAGNPEFRESVTTCLRNAYGWDVSRDNIAVTVGGQTAFFFLFMLLAGEMPAGNRRRILLPIVPEYIGYSDQGLIPEIFASKRPLIDRLDEHTFKYRIDFDSLEVGDDIGAICVSRPTNPTGNVLTDEEINHLARLAAERQIPLLIDNAYGEPFPAAVFEPIKPMWNSDMVMTFSLSKLGLPGTRTGIVLASKEIVSRISSMTCIIGLANTNMGQTIVEPLLASGEILKLARDIIRPFYQTKSQAAQALIAEHFGDDFPYLVHRSEGAFFLWLWFPELPISTRELYERLKKRGVLIVPGEYFFFGLDTGDEWPHQRQCIRLTFSQSEATVAEGIKIIADELRRIHQGSS
ncbi:valine--pyruvate transaminase [Bythopirellula polymerisocia]|uniref:Valine--pyruvate aminotransferase n=1 Tax=Bythopirellula polymerisocia TaxID=2528003 RepID=A0A5C6CKB1_9BACT|nr:valine--pyruvate transaminase [Bythopirellula polymerisocia]TWU23546.1 Valine--pyruvate aminotransferase [Bythopirellula polymerisocia]